MPVTNSRGDGWCLSDTYTFIRIYTFRSVLQRGGSIRRKRIVQQYGIMNGCLLGVDWLRGETWKHI